MNHLCMHRFSRSALGLLICGLLGSGLGRVCLADDLIASSVSPRVFFDDTDTNVTFDWTILADENTFEVFENRHGSVPFHISPGAATNNAIVVNSTGNVGLGTTVPAQKLHLVTGNTPRIRLEQNGSLDNPASTWELGANDFQFFLLDVSGNQLPFAVEAGTPTFGLYLNKKGQVGLSTDNPQGNLHIFGEANKDVFNGMGPDLNIGPSFNFGYSGNSFGPGTGFFNVRGPTSGVNPSLRFATVNQQRLIITNAGRVGIGTLSPTQQLDVSGNIRASGSFIAGGTTLNVPDYVFEPDYQLRPLPDLQAYVEKEKHLPDIPSAQEIKSQNVNLSELQMQLLKKVEELTLYSIQQNDTLAKQNDKLTSLQAHNQRLAAENAQLQDRLATIEALVKDLTRR